MSYDAEWMRENLTTLQTEDWQAIGEFLACQRTRIDADDAADLAAWFAARPELIARKDADAWSDTMNIPGPSPAMTRITVHRPMTGRGRSSGSSSSPASTSASASSPGPSSRSSAIWSAAWWVPEMIGGASLVWLAVVLFRNLRGL
jgi:hypothetical protein